MNFNLQALLVPWRALPLWLKLITLPFIVAGIGIAIDMAFVAIASVIAIVFAMFSTVFGMINWTRRKAFKANNIVRGEVVRP